MKRFEKHIFICENKRPDDHPRGCCMTKGSSLIREKFRIKLKEIGLNSTVRGNTCGCLDACEFGVVVLVYPEQIWYGNVKEEDVEEIISSHIIGNKPVERLMIKEKKFNIDAIQN